MNNLCLLFLFCLFLPAYSNYFVWIHTFWNDPPDQVEEYRKHGRSCSECHLPFTLDNVTYYGCIKKEGYEGYVCKAQNDSLIECPIDCPLGEVRAFNIKAEAEPDGGVKLLCRVTGSPKPTVTWSKDGKEVYVVPKHTDEYPTDDNYYIPLSYNEEAYGNYSCAAKNEFSSVDSLTTKYPFSYDFNGTALPVTPTNVKAEVTDAHVTLTWDYEGPEKVPDEVNFRVEKSPNPGGNPTHHPWLRQNTLTIQHLKPGRTYQFRVRAESKIGYGLFSESVKVTIPKNAKIERAVNLTVTDINWFSLTLNWDYDGDLEKDQVNTFWVSIKPGLDGEEETIKQAWRTLKQQFLPLIPYTEYELKVMRGGHAKQKYMRTSESIRVRTEGVHPSVESFEINYMDDFTIEFTCTAYGAPAPTIEFHRDLLGSPPADAKTLVTYQSNDRTTAKFFLPKDSIMGEYEFTRVTRYSCVPKNLEGEDRQMINFKEDAFQAPETIDDLYASMSESLTELRYQLRKLEAKKNS